MREGIFVLLKDNLETWILSNSTGKWVMSGGLCRDGEGAVAPL